VRQWFEFPFAADCCPCVEKLRTVLPSTVGIRDGVVHLVFTLGSAVVVSTRGGRLAARHSALVGPACVALSLVRGGLWGGWFAAQSTAWVRCSTPPSRNAEFRGFLGTRAPLVM
jgi:hypothetical protein